MKNNEFFFFEKEHQNFVQSTLYRELKNEFDYLFLDFINDNTNIQHNSYGSHRKSWFDSSILYYSIFIYLNKIIKDSHNKIADIGCGYNFIKKYFPNIVGYDKTKEADHYEWFDENFVKKNSEKFDVAIAINSLHFISIHDFSNRINEFGKIIRPGGTGFATFNLKRMIDNSDYNDLKDLSTINDYYNFINSQVKKINYEIIAFDNLLLYNHDTFEKMKIKIFNQLKGDSWPSYNDIANNQYVCKDNNIISEIDDFKTKVNNIFNYDINDPFNGNIRIIFKKQ